MPRIASARAAGVEAGGGCHPFDYAELGGELAESPNHSVHNSQAAGFGRIILDGCSIMTSDLQKATSQTQTMRHRSASHAFVPESHATRRQNRSGFAEKNYRREIFSANPKARVRRSWRRVIFSRDGSVGS